MVPTIMASPWFNSATHGIACLVPPTHAGPDHSYRSLFVKLYERLKRENYGLWANSKIFILVTTFSRAIWMGYHYSACIMTVWPLIFNLIFILGISWCEFIWPIRFVDMFYLLFLRNFSLYSALGREREKNFSYL